MSSETLSKDQQSMSHIIAPLLAIIVGMFMVILDGTAMNVALPRLQEDFGRTLNVVQWSVIGYALSQAAVIPLAGWLSDRFGAKNIFLISVVLFTLGSGLCAMAGSIEQLIAYRVIQGLGGGMVAPIAMAFTYRLAPPGKVGAVMGMIGIPMLLAPALGPVIGGWLIENATWHWIFLINLPIGVVAVLIGIKTLPAISRQQVPTLDTLGMIFGPIAFSALAYGVSEGGNSWTSAKTLTGIIVGGVALIIFIIVELNRKQPLLELRVFRSGNFTKGIIVQWVSQIALFGTMFMIPLFLIQAKNYGAFETGVIMLPMALASAVCMPIGGKLYDKLGARVPVIGGLVIVTLAAFLLSQVTTDTTKYGYILPFALLGAGMGLSMMPLNTHIIQSAPANLVGRVTSLTAALQQVVTSFAIAILTTILANRIEHYAPTYGNDPSALMSKSFGDMFSVLIYIGAAGILFGFLLSRPKRQEGDSGEGSEKPEMTMMINH
ncbi:DHA2 family efflux MFS transporter permease subunit [Paenibacillus sp. MMS18-CY102]|uniref:DHA2 family efflux MFS transporter permease subunit n=1 Tax=Paenibacillus sp. MMS18-CY102 TaxID=2682849 RepID=UPI00136522C9|nr:DHA2 family efflux MFS transporter permease subunit [Paenibacillus sp. MMS18-CY102]MWC31188.1 DHA2 family efflux MFS transporter permease subunit [Paenibacillus sp. MMS18-CY102]